jgi:hypothetical protein
LDKECKKQEKGFAHLSVNFSIVSVFVIAAYVKAFAMAWQ